MRVLNGLGVYMGVAPRVPTLRDDVDVVFDDEEDIEDDSLWHLWARFFPIFVTRL